jgi:hypothetical protein
MEKNVLFEKLTINQFITNLNIKNPTGIIPNNQEILNLNEEFTKLLHFDNFN